MTGPVAVSVRSPPCARPSACRPTTSARTSSRWCARSARCSARTAACSSSTTTRPTAPARSPTGSRGELAVVDVLHRERKEGLGPAYLAGFRRALADGAELVLEMDCDFSHDPADVPRLIAAAERRRPRARLALRPAAAASANWGRGRLFISRGRLALRAACCSASPVRDLTGGFKCFRRAVLETIDLDAIRLEGLRLPDRDDVPRAARGLPRRRGADHVRRPRGGRLEDEPRDRARGDLEGAAAPARGALRGRL